MQRTTWSRRHGADDHDRCNGMRPRTAGTRSCLRWPLLYRRSNDAHLLSPGLSCAARTIEERALLLLGCRSRGRRLPTVPALPPGDRAVLAGMEWLTHDRRARPSPDRKRCIGWQRRIGRRTCRQTRCRRAASRSTVHQAPRRKSEPGCPDSSCATAKRLLDTTERPMSQIAHGCGLRQPASI